MRQGQPQTRKQRRCLQKKSDPRNFRPRPITASSSSSAETMGPKSAPTNANKQALILAWFHSTAVAHNIKDLEKALPSVGSINGMHVKDYLQALSDDNKIRVEKIGSGNWYWSFPSDEKKAKEALLEKAQQEHAKALATVAELEAKIDEAGMARADDQDMLMGSDRKALVAQHAQLTREVDVLRGQMATYSDQDPVEMDKVKQETLQYRNEAESLTDKILSMEAWLKDKVAGDREQVAAMLKMYYGDEYDEEEGCLREL